MFNIKKITCFALASAALCLSLCSCTPMGENSEETADSPSEVISDIVSDITPDGSNTTESRTENAASGVVESDSDAQRSVRDRMGK